MKYFSMFTGIGGFELGINKAVQHIKEQSRKRDSLSSEGDCSNNERKSWEDYTCVGYSEIDKYSIQTYEKNFKGVKNYGDATQIRPEELPDFDMLCGGFPCQAFSIAGKRGGFTDTRGTLFFDIARILKVKRPKLILLENVKGLLNHEEGKTFSTIIQTLEELGYRTQWMVLNSKFFGVPQNRERVFIIGSLRGERRPEILPFGCSNTEINKTEKFSEQISNCLRTNYSNGHSNETYIKQLNNPTHSNNRLYGEYGISPALNTAQEGNRQPKIRAVLTPDRPEKRQNGRRFKENGEPMFTLTGQDKHGVAIMDLYNKKEHSDRCPTLTEPHHNTLRVRENTNIRRLTPLECELLQSFPQGWTEFGIEDFLNPEILNKGYGTEEKTNTFKILQILWEEVGEDERKGWGLNEFITFFKKEILQQRVYEKGLQGEMDKKRSFARRIQLSCKTNSYFFKMRNLWLKEKPRYTPQRQEEIEQQFKKLTMSMQKLSQQGSSQRIILMSDTQRYKQCGNAVTVNVIEAIMRRLICE